MKTALSQCYEDAKRWGMVDWLEKVEAWASAQDETGKMKEPVDFWLLVIDHLGTAGFVPRSQMHYAEVGIGFLLRAWTNGKQLRDQILKDAERKGYSLLHF